MGKWSNANLFERVRFPLVFGTFLCLPVVVFLKYRESFADEIRARQMQKEGHGISWTKKFGIDDRGMHDHFDKFQKASWEKHEAERRKYLGDNIPWVKKSDD